jgi:hypothetical protein
MSGLETPLHFEQFGDAAAEAGQLGQSARPSIFLA